MPDQRDWRFCHKCNLLFFNGAPDKGACPALGPHEASGFNFELPHDNPETPNAQAGWRFCVKCSVMYFDGFPEKGSCARDGLGHAAAGFMFVLPHDLPETEIGQANWRFCTKCHGMCFDGFDAKGVCNAGGSHAAAGFNFVLPHHDEVRDFDSGPITVAGDLPLSGSAHLVISRSGNFTLTTHAHDAGFDNIHYTLGAVLTTAGGIAATFQVSGGLEGTSAGLPFGTPDRDDDQTHTDHNQVITDQFDNFANGRFVVKLGGSDVLVDAVGDALKEAGEAAATAVVALVVA